MLKNKFPEQGPGNLIECVAEAMRGTGLINETNNVFLQCPIVVQAMSANNAGQRACLNRFFYSQLATLNVATQEPRYCLIPDGSIEMWFDLFSRKVLPYCAEYRLPVRNWK